MTQQHTTRVLERAAEGDIAAAAELLPLVYDELRALAAASFRDERRDHTLQPTALVHEAYVRLIDGETIEWRSRGQFFVIAAKAMRHILVDHARARGRAKRGGDWQRITLAAADAALAAEGLGGGVNETDLDLERLDDALARLAALDERKARLVELRFFAGLDERTAAEVLGIARSTASEHWRMARAWLHRELRRESVTGEPASERVSERHSDRDSDRGTPSP